VILEVADDLCHDYEGSALDERWRRKYIETADESGAFK